MVNGNNSWVFGGSTWESDVSSSGISFANMTSNISINLGFEMIRISIIQRQSRPDQAATNGAESWSNRDRRNPKAMTSKQQFQLASLQPSLTCNKSMRLKGKIRSRHDLTMTLLQTRSQVTEPRWQKSAPKLTKITCEFRPSPDAHGSVQGNSRLSAEIPNDSKNRLSPVGLSTYFATSAWMWMLCRATR